MKSFLKITSLTALMALSIQSFADPTCSTEPKEKWQESEQFKANLEQQGYKLKKFKETKTGCYEIYGWNKEGQKVEIYFNPVNGEIVKQEIDD